MKPVSLCEVCMKGKQQVKVSNRNASFRFELNRNITILCGDSGTGKTTLYRMIADHTRLGEASGVNLQSSKPCVALVDLDWRHQLQGISDSIVFIDEGMQDIFTHDFAQTVKNSDNYYVIITREALYELPYSVDEIYELKTSGKMHTFKKHYPARKFHRYTAAQRGEDKFHIVLTEDAHSGYQFFEQFFRETDVQCVFAGSNSNIYPWLTAHPNEPVLVIADGAAFGAEMGRVMKHCDREYSVHQLCLPESFEWLVLASGLIKADRLEDVLKNTSEYVESSEYFSWENFFTAYLIAQTNRTPFQYQKTKLNPVYLQPANRERIAAEILREKKKKE